MSSNDKAKPVDIIFNRGVRQDLDPHTATPGSLVRCDNLEFDQLGRIVKRDGFALLGTTLLSKSSTLTTQVRRFTQTPDGDRLFFSDDNTYQYVPNADKICEAGLDGQSSALRANMVEMQGIVSDQAGAILFTDSICVSGYIVYLYLQVPTAGGNADVCVDVIDAASGARVFTRKKLGSSAGAYPPRLVQCGGTSRVFALWEKAGGTAIQQARCDFASQPLSWTAAFDFVTTTGPAIFDAIALASGWALVYYDQSVNKAIVETVDLTPSVTHTFTWQANGGTAAWQPTILSIVGDAVYSGAKIYAVGYNGATQFIESVVLSITLTGATYGRFNPGLTIGRNAVQMALTRTSQGGAIYAFSNYTSEPTAFNPRGHLYLYTIDDTSASSLQQLFANYSIGSRFYTDSPARNRPIFLTARFNEAGGLQSHYLLLDLGGIDGHLLSAQPVCHFAAGRIPYDDDHTYTGIAGIADLSSIQAGLFQVVGLVQIGASVLSGNQIQAWTFQSLGSSRFLSTDAQGQEIIGGGTPLVYDGQRLVEESFYSYPSVIAGAGYPAGQYTVSAVGGNIARGTYQYRIVWEWTDAVGNRHQSPASPAVTIDMSTATFAPGTGSVQGHVPVLHATRKQGGPGVSPDWSPVLAQPYRTTNLGSVFYKLPAAAINNTASTTEVTFVDTMPDDFISAQEPLYTAAGGLGLLASTAPPASLVLCTHQQRLWGVDIENRERIWCTRVLQPGSAAAYSPALQILIPGAGVINGLGAQDGKLYALATNGIYLASYGDGPDDTGGGAFPSPELITTTANCQDPRGVLVGQEGIYFVGKDQWGTGVYLIPRGDGTPHSIGKRVRTELAACPVCRGIVNRTGKARTEFLFVDSDTAPTKGVILYYHHDYLDDEGIGQWTVARVNTDLSIPGVALECLGTWDDQSVIVDETNDIGWQETGVTRDFGITYVTTLLETTDIRPAGLLGFARVSGVTVLGTQSSPDPLEIELSYDSGFTWADAYQWVASTESAGQPVLRQREPVTQKQFDGSTIRVRLANPTLGGSNPGATYFHGITIEVAALGGVARLDDARRA